ncbi:sensor histidine kinase [Minwuia sp.]|uniref:sensor histidine kinase n=1 Tax=Minwuia sp. TaxID=2493630 RepID=UPI003A8D933F
MWLRFGQGELERNFIRNWRSASRATNRIWSGCALCFYFLFLVALYRLDPDYAVNDQPFRLYVCLPVLIVEFGFALWMNGRTRIYDAMYLIASLTCFANALVSYGLAPEHLRFFFLMEMTLIFVFCGSYFRASYFRVLIFTVVSLGAATPVILAVHVAAGTGPMQLAAEMFMVLCLTATVVLTAYHRELLARRNFRDILVARQEEARTEQLAGLATADSEAKSQFLAAVGSEFELVIRNITDQSTRSGDGPQNERLDRYMTDIHDSAQRLQKTVQQIIAVSGSSELNRSTDTRTFSLLEATKHALTHHPALNGHPVPLLVNPGGDPGMQIVANADDVSELLDELIANAVRHGRETDGIRCELTAIAGGPIELRMFNPCQGLEGMDLERVFEPFVLMDDRLERSSEGLGLGLPLARNLARSNGGSLMLELAASGNVVAVLNLPAAGEAA